MSIVRINFSMKNFKKWEVTMASMLASLANVMSTKIQHGM